MSEQVDNGVPTDRFLDREAETMSRSDLEAWQEQRILELAPYVYERSGLIRQTWEQAGVHPRDIRSIADFRERVPFISKAAIQQFRDRYGDPFGGLCCVAPSDIRMVWSTGGTTGEPQFLPDRWVGGTVPVSYLFARSFWELGLRPGDHALGSGFTSRGTMYIDAYQHCGAVPIFVDSQLGDWRELLQLVHRYEVPFLIINLPVVVEWDRLASQLEMKELLSSVRYVAYAGEPLGPRMRGLLEGWGPAVSLHAGSGDVAASFGCLEGDGLHLWEDFGLYECLETDGTAPVTDGEVGELVSTALDDPIAPLVRYRSDDLVRIVRERCGCGRTHARQWPLGRKGDQVLVEGRSVLPIDVWAAIEGVDETHAGLFQIVRTAREMERLQLRVGYDPARVTKLADTTERVAAAVFEAVTVDPLLEMVPDAELLAQGPAHKIPRVAPR